MKAVALALAVESFPDTLIKIDPSRGFAASAFFSGGKPVADRCKVFTTFGTFTIRGTVEEVSAALEAATASPAPTPVVVEPSDLEIAAKVLDAVSKAIVDCDENDAVDDLASALFDVINMGGQTHIVLTALANRLRGGA